MSDLELAYFAGFIDGEGCITINDRRINAPNYSRVYCGMVKAYNTNPMVLNLLKEHFGGSILIQNVNRKRGHKPVFAWTLCSKSAADFLRAIRPYLRMKGEQADIVITLQSIMGKRKGMNRLTMDEVLMRSEFKERIRFLNQRGITVTNER